METFSEQKAPEAIRNCAVKSASYGNQGFEVVASPKKLVWLGLRGYLNCLKILILLTQTIQNRWAWRRLTIFVPNQRVTVQVKVLKVEGVIEVNKKGSWKTLDKQEVLVGDHSDVTRVVLWEGDVGRLDKGKSYALHCLWSWIAVRRTETISSLNRSTRKSRKSSEIFILLKDQLLLQ